MVGIHPEKKLAANAVSIYALGNTRIIAEYKNVQYEKDIAAF